MTMNKKGVSIIAAIGIMLILSLLGIVGVSLLGSLAVSGVDYFQSQKSFYLAEAGLKWYMEQLKNDSNWSDNYTVLSPKGPITFSGGTFTIAVSNCQVNLIDVVSTGAIAGYEGETIKRVVSAHVIRVLEPFNYALYVGGTVNTQGSDNFVVNGSQLQNAANLPVVDYSYYSSIANHVITANYTFAAGTYSGVWYIEGDVTIDSNVTINGSIITTGGINMKNNSNITVSASLPYPALVSNGNFQFQGVTNLKVDGLIYVGADLSGNFLMQQSENVVFNGTVIVAGNFNLQQGDNVAINYNAAIAENPPPGFTGLGSTSNLNVINWKEVL